MRKILLLMLTVLLGVSLWGCLDAEGAYDNGEIFDGVKREVMSKDHAVSRPIEITFWSANSAIDIQGSTMATLVERFNQEQLEKYPESNIKVKPTFNGGYIVQNQKLQAALAGKNNPDIAMVGVSSISLYYKYAVDMREIFTEAELRDIFEGFLQFAMYRKKFVAYPYFAATNVLLCNLDMFKNSGLEIPTVEQIVNDPENSYWTWEYFEKVMAGIKTAYAPVKKDEEPNPLNPTNENKYFGLGLLGIPLYESFYSYGEAPYNPNATKIAFSKEVATEIFTYWQNMGKAGYFENPVNDPNHNKQIQGRFISGEYGSLISSSSFIKSVINNVILEPRQKAIDEARAEAIEKAKQKAQEEGKEEPKLEDIELPKDEDVAWEPRFELGVLPHPKQEYFYSNQSGGGLLVFDNRGEAKKRAAVEFLRWLQAPEQQAYFASESGYLITTRAAQQTEIWQKYNEISTIPNQTLALMKFVPQKGLKLPIGRSKALADDDFGKYARGIFYENMSAAPADVVKECIDRVGYVLDANKDL